MNSNLLDNLYTKTDNYICAEADDPIYEVGVIDAIEQYFYEMAIEIKTNMYWEGNMEYGCFSVAWFENEKLYLECFSIGPRVR